MGKSSKDMSQQNARMPDVGGIKMVALCDGEKLTTDV